MSIPLSYPIAKEILTDVEKERIVCTYLNATDTNAVSTQQEKKPLSPSEAKQRQSRATHPLLPSLPSTKPSHHP
jgi:hypothetical protein